jgi:hypothetical protein
VDKVTEFPEQKVVAEPALMLTTGKGFTTTTRPLLALSVQFEALVTLTL